MSDHDNGNGYLPPGMSPPTQRGEIARLDARIDEWNGILNRSHGELEARETKRGAEISTIHREVMGLSTTVNDLRVSLENRISRLGDMLELVLRAKGLPVPPR